VAVTRHAPVRRTLLAAVVAGLAAAAAAAGAGGGGGVVPTIAVTKTAVNATWKEGWLLPGRAVVVTGTSDGAATIRAILERVGPPKTQPVRVDRNITRAGTFTLTLPLYVRSLPGKYTLRIVGLGESVGLEPAVATVALPFPLEGVVDRAEVGTTKNGPWHVYDIDHHTSPVLHGEYKTLYTRFRFLSPPRGGRIQVVWKQQWRTIVGKKYKAYRDTIYTFASSGKPLPAGTWLVTLVVNDRVAKRGSVRIVE
jgi:hypothetical protein